MPRLDAEQVLERVRLWVITREPLPLVDRLLEIEPGQRARSLKNVGANESFFAGHFPGRPVLPGVLILEAMRQTIWAAVVAAAGVLDTSAVGPGAGNPGGPGQIDWQHEGQHEGPALLGVESARFRRPVLPGDQLAIEVERDPDQLEPMDSEGKRCEQHWRAQASVNGETAAQAVFRVGTTRTGATGLRS